MESLVETIGFDTAEGVAVPDAPVDSGDDAGLQGEFQPLILPRIFSGVSLYSGVSSIASRLVSTPPSTPS